MQQRALPQLYQIQVIALIIVHLRRLLHLHLPLPDLLQVHCAPATTTLQTPQESLTARVGHLFSADAGEGADGAGLRVISAWTRRIKTENGLEKHLGAWDVAKWREKLREIKLTILWEQGGVVVLGEIEIDFLHRPPFADCCVRTKSAAKKMEFFAMIS